MLLGLTRPTAGTVELLGHAGDDLPAALPDVGALVEGPGFHPFLSGRDNLLRCAAAEPRLDGDLRGPVDAALERVGLADAARRRYRGYSLGMKQRLGLAAALLVPRRLVVLDEPTNGLDPAGTRDVRRVVAELHDAGATVLLSSHLLAEVEAVCSHVAVLQTGTLLVAGELAALLDADTGGLVVSTPDADDAILALRAAGASAYRAEGGVAVPPGPLEAPEIVAALVGAGVAVWEVHRRRAHLEELFARLTEEDA
jgi:ABC-2 type transport system ATP-binding protein